MSVLAHAVRFRDHVERVGSLDGKPKATGFDQGFLMLDKAKFPEAFAADVRPEVATSWQNSQVPWGVAALNGTITDPAWRNKRSRYLSVTSDKMIAPPLQQFMAKRANATIAETPGSHAIYVSQPAVVARIIEQAATAEELAATSGSLR